MAELVAALIAGPMYDSLYGAIADFTRETGIAVTIGYRAPHPDLNAHLASFEQPPYDLVSSHTKYAPSQLAILAPIEQEPEDFYPSVFGLASIGGQLYGVPRNVDVQLLHYRTGLIAGPPPPWDALLEVEPIEQ